MIADSEGSVRMSAKNWKKEILTIPNLLSLFRLLLIPVYVYIYLNAQSTVDYYIAAAILAVSCLTDMVDGQIARRFHMITNLGKILDPLADKITQLTLILCLAVRFPVIWIMVGLFFVKELFQVIAGYMLLRKGLILKGAQYSGKISTTVLFVSLIVMVMFPQIPDTAVIWITVIDCIFLLVAFIDYIWVYASKKYEFEPLDQEHE